MASTGCSLVAQASTATLCMRKADRISISHTTNTSFWRVCGAQAAGDQRRVLLSVADCPRDASASVRGFGVVAISTAQLGGSVSGSVLQL